jgi:hypothetical protein
MKVIAKNASNKYMVLISKEEILEICFGVKNADYNKQFSDRVKQFIQNVDKGEFEIDVSKGFTNAMYFISTKVGGNSSFGFTTIKEQLEKLLATMNELEKFKEGFVQPFKEEENG